VLATINKHVFFFLLIFSFQKVFTQEKTYGTYSPIVGHPDNSSIMNLQKIIDAAEPGDTILLAPGMYKAPVHIKKNGIVLDGNGKCTITGLNYESVIYIEADSVHIKNFIITDSGTSHDKIDCGISIRGNYNIVENCRVQNCLFGIDIQKSNYNKVLHTEITSFLDRELAFKGDAIRLWYSKRNLIKHNYWYNVRDMVVWYSAENTFEGNKGVGNRYGIHFMYSHNNRISFNELYDNSVGVFLMYSEKTILNDNTIMRCKGPSGMCLGMKETSSNQILNNRFIGSAEGIHIDTSPFEPGKTNTFDNNEIAFCGVAIQFHSSLDGNLIKDNYFHDNLTQVAVRGKSARRNKWEHNYWDDYQGFDKDKNNVGDVSYKLFSYVEHLWSFNQNVKFFYGAPFLVVLDFLERLAPFSAPKFVVEDKTPIFLWEERKN